LSDTGTAVCHRDIVVVFQYDCRRHNRHHSGPADPGLHHRRPGYIIAHDSGRSATKLRLTPELGAKRECACVGANGRAWPIFCDCPISHGLNAVPRPGQDVSQAPEGTRLRKAERKLALPPTCVYAGVSEYWVVAHTFQRLELKSSLGLRTVQR
jgi:hypothetical protein